MSVLDRAALEGSPLADLHALASELSIDGSRRLRRADLIDAILAKQGGGKEAPHDAETGTNGDTEEPEPAGTSQLTSAVADELRIHDGEQPRRRRGRRGRRSRSGAREEATTDRHGDAAEKRQDDDQKDDTENGQQETAEEHPAATPEPRDAEPEGAGAPEDEVVEGVVELISNGSGFLRVQPPEPSDDDIYISAAQVKRCELVSGDRITGPRRAPRRSERFAALLRIDTINDRPAEEVADSAHFDDLPAAFPTERLRLGSEDPTIKAIEWLTPLGKGSRVSIVEGARAGKTEALRRLVSVLSADEGLHVAGLAGVRPEELSEWPQSARRSPASPLPQATREPNQGAPAAAVLLNPRALAEACTALLGDPDRRARLGAAARARALELFTVEQNVAAFRGIYLELISHTPSRPVASRGRDAQGVPQPFARPAESHVPGRWAVTGAATRTAVPAGSHAELGGARGDPATALPVQAGGCAEPGGAPGIRGRPESKGRPASEGRDS